jgi:hypothetical protein
MTRLPFNAGTGILISWIPEDREKQRETASCSCSLIGWGGITSSFGNLMKEKFGFLEESKE